MEEQGLKSDSSLPALFWDSVPEDPDNPDVAALQALAEESSPEEKAESFKDIGNQALKTAIKARNRAYMHQAIQEYDKGLALKCNSYTLNSVLHSNKAQVNLLLGNHRKALTDSLEAIKLNSENIKAYYRGAKAAIKLGEFATAIDICKKGMRLELDAEELLALLKDAESKAKESEDKEKAQRQQGLVARLPARQVAVALHQRGLQVGRPQISIGTRKPFLEGDSGIVHWPVMFLYPESMQSDAVEDFSELDTFADHLDLMFGPGAPPLAWDEKREYQRDKLEIYFLSNAAKALDLDTLTECLYGGWPANLPQEEGPSRYGPDAAKWVEVAETDTLAAALSHPQHVIPGIPVFFLLAQGTEYHTRFLAGDISVAG